MELQVNITGLFYLVRKEKNQRSLCFFLQEGSKVLPLFDTVEEALKVANIIWLSHLFAPNKVSFDPNPHHPRNVNIDKLQIKETVFEVYKMDKITAYDFSMGLGEDIKYGHRIGEKVITFDIRV